MRFRHGDGTQGWKGHAPFDGILVAAAPLTVPEALLKQLKVGGRLLVPVGPEGEQQLVRFTRREQRIEREALRSGCLRPAARRHGLKFLRNCAVCARLWSLNNMSYIS